MKNSIIKKLICGMLVLVTVCTTTAANTAVAEAAGSNRPVSETRIIDYTQAKNLTPEQIATLRTIFEGEHYAKLYPDIKDAFGTDYDAMFNHWITCGIWEYRQPSAAFNVDAFASNAVDLQPIYGPDMIAYYMHYATHPRETWRVGNNLDDAGKHGATVYSVTDFVVGQTGPRKGAWPIQTPADWNIYVKHLLEDSDRDVIN